MANVKISDLTAALAAAGANEIEINEAGVTKKITVTQIATYLAALSESLTGKTINLTNNTLTGTKTQFDTACSDGNFVYNGDVITSLTGTKAQFDTAVSDGNICFDGDLVTNLNVSNNNRIAARATAGAGALEECTTSQVLDFLANTRGDILYRGASGWAALAAGTSGYYLKANGAGADPAWAAVAVGGFTSVSASLSSVSSYTFSSIPSGTSVIFIYFDPGSSQRSATLQLGDSGGLETTGYTGYYYGANSGGLSANFLFSSTTNNDMPHFGTLIKLNSSNQWAFCGHNVLGATAHETCIGKKTLSAELDRIGFAFGGSVTGGTIAICYK